MFPANDVICKGKLENLTHNTNA